MSSRHNFSHDSNIYESNNKFVSHLHLMNNMVVFPKSSYQDLFFKNSLSRSIGKDPNINSH
jgi:hypothetical protein